MTGGTASAYCTTPSCHLIRRRDFRAACGCSTTISHVTRCPTIRQASDEPTFSRSLPKYPMPVALIGRLAVHQRAHGRRFGEKLLIDALQRVVVAADIVGCVGVVVDAKDEGAEQFYAKYDLTTIHAENWPRRMFLSNRRGQDSVAAVKGLRRTRQCSTFS